MVKKIALHILYLAVIAAYAFLIGCPLKRFTGFDCAFCGMTRAHLAFFSGNFQRGFRLSRAFLFRYTVFFRHCAYADFQKAQGFIHCGYLFCGFVRGRVYRKVHNNSYIIKTGGLLSACFYVICAFLIFSQTVLRKNALRRYS